MFNTARVLIAVAAMAVALPVASQTTDAKKPAAEPTAQDKVIERTGNETRPTSSPKTMTADEAKADKAKKRAEATKPAATPQEKRQEYTGNETRPTSSPNKMTPEEKAKDKAAKRTGMTREEQEKAAKQSPGS